MPKTNLLKLETRCQIATLQKRPIKPMSLSILAKKMENTRTAKTGKKEPLMTVKFLERVIRMGTSRQSKLKTAPSI